MGNVKWMSFPLSQSSSQINTAILCTILVLYVALSQASSPELYIFKQNARDVIVKMTIPPKSSNIPLIRVGSSADIDKALFYITSDLSVRLTKDYEGKITTTVENKPQQTMEIKFDQIKLDYAGTYKCYESAGVKTFDDCGFKIVVLANPSQPVIKVSTDSSLLVGQTTRLQCDFISNTKPSDHGLKPLVVWFDAQGKEITSTLTKVSVTANGTLVVPDVTRSDLGITVTCNAADDAGEKIKNQLFSARSEAYTLIPQYPPGEGDFTITPTITNNTVILKPENSELKYACSVDCQPACTVQWKQMQYGTTKFRDMPLASDPKVLFLDAVTRKDHGYFICEGENEHGRSNKGFILEVQYILTPEVVVTDTGKWRKTVSEDEKEEVKLTCYVDSNPKPTVVWKNPENWLINQSIFTTHSPGMSNNSLPLHRYSSKITLTDLKCEDGGKYTCEAENSLKITKKEGIDIEVKCQPSAVVVDQYNGIKEDVVMKKEYVWELGSTLTGQFLIRAWPRPQVTRVASTLNGDSRTESQMKDVSINAQNPYIGRDYLTLFEFTSKRDLTLDDRGRVYTFELDNNNYKTPFSFTIQPRGPPLPVSSLNATSIRHNAVVVSWTPEFDGGELQTFTVYLRRHQSSQDVDNHLSDSSDWKLVKSDIVADVQDGGVDSTGGGGENRVELKVKSLSAQTSYDLVVLAVNSRGNATSLMTFKTKASPVSSANTGAIVGSVFAVLIVLVIVGLLLFYFLVYKKRRGKVGDGESRIPMIGRVTKLFGGKKKQDPNGNVGAADKTPKFRPIFIKKSKTPKPKDKDYSNIPTESVDPTEYANADSLPKKTPVSFADNTSTSPDPGYNVDAKGDDREVTDDGLTYVKIDFRDKPNPVPKPRRMDSREGEVGVGGPSSDGRGGGCGEDDACQYMAIDFEKTKAKEEDLKRQKEEEERKKKEEEDRRKKEEEEEDHYENLPSYGTTV